MNTTGRRDTRPLPKQNPTMHVPMREWRPTRYQPFVEYITAVQVLVEWWPQDCAPLSLSLTHTHTHEQDIF